MNKEFVPYEIALALKELGFNESCFGYYENGVFIFWYDSKQDYELLLNCSTPTLSQAFRWFREKYKNLHGSIEQTNSYKDEYTVYIGRFGYIEGNLKDEPKVFISYEEAELECLKKLIEIVKNAKTN